MTDTQMDGGSADGTATNANGGASETQGVQHPSFDAAKLQSSIDALIGKVDQLEARTNGLQSVKDKTTKEISGLKAQIAEYEQLKERLGSDGAIEQIELKQTLTELKDQISKLGSVSTQTTGTGASGVVDAAQVIRDYGLDMNDPKVALLASRQYQNADEVDLAIARHIKAQRQAPSPTPAQTLTDVGNPPPSEGLKEKTQKYINDVRAARGRPDEINRLREQAIQDGVKTWEIDFT